MSARDWLSIAALVFLLIGDRGLGNSFCLVLRPAVYYVSSYRARFKIRD